MTSPLPERTNAAVFQQTEEQQRRGYSGTPKDTPAEGKAILKLRHKSADESQSQLKQLPHRHSMSDPHDPHKISVLMCPCTLLRVEIRPANI